MRPHTNNSFSYKTVNPAIKNILDERSKLDNTVQVAMPFVKATTTLNLPEVLGQGNVGFSLGIHATEIDVQYQDIYSNQSGEFLVGYTYQPNNTNKLIYTTPPSSQAIQALKVLDLGDELFTSTNSPNKSSVWFAPPGITNATIGRYKDGRVGKVDLNIFVPTVWHLEFLHKTFLVPGIGMIFEWGQQFAPKKTGYDIGETGLTGDFSKYMFPWYGTNAYGETKEQIFERLSRNEIGTQEILEKYVYPTQGQYQWQFGRVSHFSIKGNPDGSYNCTVRTSGPAEDSWAYSVRNTVTPPSTRDAKICIDDANSVEAYFTKTSGPNTFVGVVESTLNGNNPDLVGWQPHVIKLDKVPPPASGEDAEELPETATTSESQMNDNEDSYFISWRYFVNVILNDEIYGVKSIFKNASLPDGVLKKIALLRPYKNENGPDFDAVPIDDPFENFVGANPYLRSTDPSVLVITNERAIQYARTDEQRRRAGQVDLLDATSDSIKFLVLNGKALDFYEAAQNVQDPPPSTGEYHDRAFLSSGVWINHKQVMKSMASAQTVLDGLQSLLTAMSSATSGYWNLAIDVSEPSSPTDDNYRQDESYSYTVIDLNYHENSEYAVSEFLSGQENKVHVFNKFARQKSDGTLVGSELIDFNVDISLPQRMFAQIATLGIALPGDRSQFSEEEPPSRDIQPPTVSDPNDTIRELFSITSVARDGSGKSADLTAPPIFDLTQNILERTCGGRIDTGTQLGAPGVGADIGDRNVNNSAESEEDPEVDLNQLRAEVSVLSGSFENCKARCLVVDDTSDTDEETEGGEDVPELLNYCEFLSPGREKNFCEVAYNTGITDIYELSQLMAQTAHESARFSRTVESMNYSADGLLRTFPARINRAAEAEGISSLELANRLSRNQEAIANIVYGNRSDLGNNQPGDGWKFRGRGYIQLTGRSNYQSYANATGRNVVENPSLLESEELAIDASLWYWRTVVRRRTSNFNNTEAVTRIINNGLNGIIDRVSKYNYYLRVFSGGTIVSAPPFIPRQYDFDLQRDGCSSCDEVQTQLNQREQLLRQSETEEERQRLVERTEQQVRKFYNYTNVFRYIEPFPEYMVAQMVKSSDGSSSNAFGAAPGALSINAELTLPGINGFRLGELFWIDRVPAFYRAYGAFILFQLEDTIDTSGWKTKINSKFYYLGNAWKTQMAKVLVGDG
jgi:putative chitinase